MKKIIIIILVIIIGLVVYIFTNDRISPTPTSKQSSQKEVVVRSNDWKLLASGSLQLTEATGKKWNVTLTDDTSITDRNIVGGVTEKPVTVAAWIKSNTPFRLENYNGPGMSPSTLFVTGTVSGNTITASKIVDEGQ